jgi:hypothetical protein
MTTWSKLMHLPDPLKSGEYARLIPTVKDTSLEDRASSILLSSFHAVPEFGERMLMSIGQKVGITGKLACFSQVCFEERAKGIMRPDGFIQLTRGKKTWTAIVEAKIKNAKIEKEQLVKYIDLAKKYNVDAVITISNEFATKPDHHPIPLKVSEQKKIDVFHWSWMFAVTEALLVQQNEEIDDPAKNFILDEFLRYFDHDASGVKGFNQMNSEWKSIVQTVSKGAILKKQAPEVRNTVCSWNQEIKDLCLLLSRSLGVSVTQKLSKSHVNDPEAHIKANIDDLVDYSSLYTTLIIPDAAAPLNITIDIAMKSIECSMLLIAPSDKKQPRAQITWLINQLKKADSQNVDIRSWHKGSKIFEQVSFKKVLADPKLLVSENKDKVLMSKFEIVQRIGLGTKFSGTKTFIDELEKLVPEFYTQIGMFLKAWVPPAPKPIQDEDDD